MSGAAQSAERAPDGRLAENIVYFAQALRRAGVPVGPGQVADALRAVELVGVGPREDFYWTLHALFVRRREHATLFDQAFRIFWKNRALAESMMAMLLPTVRLPREAERPAVRQRVGEALLPKEARKPETQQEVEIDARLAVSAEEVLRTKDFDQMSAAEIERARRAIARMRLAFPPLETRRRVPAMRAGRIDPRRTLRASVRGGGGAISLRFSQPAERLPPIVAVCDISGSMSQYSRLFLHFLHALGQDRQRVHAFLFGTRLTNVTRHLQRRDPDEALARCAGAVLDWSGGTRISGALHEFNRHWSRRVLGQGATVLLITDGLERDGEGDLAREMERLHKSARRLVWLNPLLRFEGFAPKARGVRAMLPHVDAMRPIHNLESMEDLTRALAGLDASRDEMRAWRRMVVAA